MTKKFKISAAEMLCLISGFLVEGVSYGATTLKVSKNLRYAEFFNYDLNKSAAQNIADLAAIKKFNLPDILIECSVPQEDYTPQRQHLVCCA